MKNIQYLLKSIVLILLVLQVSDLHAQVLSPKESMMKNTRITSTGKLEMIASKTSSPKDFDFFVGKWKIHNRRLKTRLNNCTEWVKLDATVEMHKVFSNNIANFDSGSFDGFDGKPPFEGLTVRLFNPKTKLWSIYWAASNVGTMDPPNVGSFENGVGDFFAEDTYNGKKIIALLRWDARDKKNFKWSQAYSADNGKTWEWNWYMTYEKL